MNQRTRKTSQFPPFLQKVGKLLRAQAGQAPQFILWFVDNLMFTDRLSTTGYCGHLHPQHWASTVQCNNSSL